MTRLREELNTALADVKRLGEDLEKARQTEPSLRAEITRLLRTQSKKAPR